MKKSNKPHVVIVMAGGTVQDVVASEKVVVDIIDYDELHPTYGEPDANRLKDTQALVTVGKRRVASALDAWDQAVDQQRA